MAIAHEFEYVRPQTIAEALQAVSQYADSFRILAGGSDLVVELKENKTRPKVVVSLRSVADLRIFESCSHSIRIGAMVTMTEIIRKDWIKEFCPVLAEACQTVASVGVRNTATLVGNLCSAVPSLDSAPPLLLFDAVVVACSVRGERRIPLGEFFVAPRKTSLAPDELVLRVEVPKMGPHGACYVKLGRYKGEDLAQAGVACMVLPDHEYRIALCALGPVSRRAKKIEDFLYGKPLSRESLTQACDLLSEEISPISDVRATKEYRIHMARIMLERGLLAAQRRQRGEYVDTHGILG